MRFQVIFTYDTEYRGYVADVPELPGCMSQGKTLDEAVKNIKDAIKGYLYVQKKHNRKIKDIESESTLPTLSVPEHKELAPGLLRGLIRRAGIEIEEFLKMK